MPGAWWPRAACPMAQIFLGFGLFWVIRSGPLVCLLVCSSVPSFVRLGALAPAARAPCAWTQKFVKARDSCLPKRYKCRILFLIVLDNPIVGSISRWGVFAGVFSVGAMALASGASRRKISGFEPFLVVRSSLPVCLLFFSSVPSCVRSRAVGPAVRIRALHKFV